jgi:hypothetical protein
MHIQDVLNRIKPLNADESRILYVTQRLDFLRKARLKPVKTDRYGGSPYFQYLAFPIAI